MPEIHSIGTIKFINDYYVPCITLIYANIEKGKLYVGANDIWFSRSLFEIAEKINLEKFVELLESDTNTQNDCITSDLYTYTIFYETENISISIKSLSFDNIKDAKNNCILNKILIKDKLKEAILCQTN